MAGGRPKEYDLVQEAKELDEWSLKEDSINIYGFINPKPYVAQQITQFAKQCEEFSLSLNKAKQRISERREKLAANGSMYSGVWNRTARIYDKLLENQENE